MWLIKPSQISVRYSLSPEGMFYREVVVLLRFVCKCVSKCVTCKCAEEAWCILIWSQCWTPGHTAEAGTPSCVLVLQPSGWDQDSARLAAHWNIIQEMTCTCKHLQSLAQTLCLISHIMVKLVLFVPPFFQGNCIFIFVLNLWIYVWKFPKAPKATFSIMSIWEQLNWREFSFYLLVREHVQCAFRYCMTFKSGRFMWICLKWRF